MTVPSSNLVFFAAHAPDAPDWFVPTPLKPPTNPVPDPATSVTEPEVAAATAYLNDGTPVGGGASPQLLIFVEKVDIYKRVIAQYAMQNAAEGFFQWRWYYAQQMAMRTPKGQ